MTKPYRRNLMETWGASVVPSPSPDTNAGRSFLAENPNHTGSLGIAISEAVEDAVTSKTPTKYALLALCSTMFCCTNRSSVWKFRSSWRWRVTIPDVVVGCIGGGSNFAGFAYPFVADKVTGKAPNLRVGAIEPSATPSLTRGIYAYDFGDTSMMTPLVKMYTLGLAEALSRRPSTPVACAIMAWRRQFANSIAMGLSKPARSINWQTRSWTFVCSQRRHPASP